MTAKKRYRHGLYDYNPKRNTAARYRKRVEGPAAKRRREKAAARAAAPAKRASWRRPTGGYDDAIRGRRLLDQLPRDRWPAEAKHLEAQARRDADYRPFWDDYAADYYARRYRDRQAPGRAAAAVKRKRTTAAKRKASAWVTVKAHRRRRPGR